MCYIDDDGEGFENSSYDDIMEHIRYSQLGCHCFKKLFINLSRTVEDLVLISYMSIQDYFQYKSPKKDFLIKRWASIFIS